MTEITTKPSHWSWRRSAILVGILLLLGLAWWLSRSAMDPALAPGTADRPTFTVHRGDLEISVLEGGTIRAREQVTIKSEVEGRTTILYLIKEGVQVKPGDLLVELDASQLEDQKVDQQIKVQNSEASFIRARETLEVTQNQTQSDVDKAELDARFAKEDLAKYLDGDYPKELKEAESRITVAREELRRAEEKLEWSKVLFKEKYISQTELQADELAAQKTRLDLDLAIANRDLLKNFTFTRRRAELESGVRQTALALERARRKATADLVQAKADLRARESEFGREKDKLDKLLRQIEKTRILAPSEGLVVYASSGQMSWRSNSEPLGEGAEVRERQELIYLPKPGSVMAEIKIHESSLEKVRVGLPVRITVDALPGKVFNGKLDSIAPLPDAMSAWLNPDLKLYNSEVSLQIDQDELRTGMSCKAEVLIDRYADALFVPVQAVTKVDKKPTVYIVHGGAAEPRPVQIGLSNSTMVHILEGLREGETVLLNPPFSNERPAPGTDREEDLG